MSYATKFISGVNGLEVYRTSLVNIMYLQQRLMPTKLQTKAHLTHPHAVERLSLAQSSSGDESVYSVTSIRDRPGK